MEITTNRIARTRGQQEELRRTMYAINAQIADIEDRIKQSQNDFIKQAWTVAIIELHQLQRTLQERKVA